MSEGVGAGVGCAEVKNEMESRSRMQQRRGMRRRHILVELVRCKVDLTADLPGKRRSRPAGQRGIREPLCAPESDLRGMRVYNCGF
jgi:hypothetical protein